MVVQLLITTTVEGNTIIIAFWREYRSFRIVARALWLDCACFPSKSHKMSERIYTAYNFPFLRQKALSGQLLFKPNA